METDRSHAPRRDAPAAVPGASIPEEDLIDDGLDSIALVTDRALPLFLQSIPPTTFATPYTFPFDCHFHSLTDDED